MKIELNATIFGMPFKKEVTDVDHILIYPGDIKVIYREKDGVFKSNTIKFKGKIPQYFKVIEDEAILEKGYNSVKPDFRSSGLIKFPKSEEDKYEVITDIQLNHMALMKDRSLQPGFIYIKEDNPQTSKFYCRFLLCDHENNKGKNCRYLNCPEPDGKYPSPEFFKIFESRIPKEFKTPKSQDYVNPHGKSLLEIHFLEEIKKLNGIIAEYLKENLELKTKYDISLETIGDLQVKNAELDKEDKENHLTILNYKFKDQIFALGKRIIELNFNDIFNRIAIKEMKNKQKGLHLDNDERGNLIDIIDERNKEIEELKSQRDAIIQQTNFNDLFNRIALERYKNKHSLILNEVKKLLRHFDIGDRNEISLKILPYDLKILIKDIVKLYK